MKYSSFVFALFSMLTLCAHAMNPHETDSVDWIESNDVYENIYTIRCSLQGSYLGIKGLIEVIRKRDLRSGKLLKLSGILYPPNTDPLEIPFSWTTTIFDQMSHLHYKDLLRQEAERKAQAKAAKKLALAAAPKDDKTTWRPGLLAAEPFDN